jgi:hypothetical protein
VDVKSVDNVHNSVNKDYKGIIRVDKNSIKKTHHLWIMWEEVRKGRYSGKNIVDKPVDSVDNRTYVLVFIILQNTGILFMNIYVHTYPVRTYK